MTGVAVFYFIFMPSHKSAEKAVRQTLRRANVNRARKSRIHTFVRDVEAAAIALEHGHDVTKEALEKSFVSAEKELMRGASKGVMHKNAAARKVSRLYNKVKAAITKKSSAGQSGE